MASSIFAHKSRLVLFRYKPNFICESLRYLSTSSEYSANSLMEKYDLSPETASRVVSITSRMRNPQNSCSVLDFFKETGFSNKQIDKVVGRNPQLVSFCLESNIKPKIKIFRDLGFSDTQIAQMVEKESYLLLSSAINRIAPSVSVLRGQLGCNAQVARLLTSSSSSSLLYTNLEKTMLPNIEYFKSCGVSSEQINRSLFSFPSMFTHSPESIRKVMDKVDEMGVERNSKMFIYAVRAVSSMSEETFELKLKTFQELGFSEDDILRAFRSAPQCLSVSGRKLKKIKQVLLETGKYDMSCILRNPQSLMFSVEKRYKPRLQVLKVLEKRNLITKWPSLSKLCTLPNESFFQEFVAPNMNAVGDLSISKAIDSEDKLIQCIEC